MNRTAKWGLIAVLILGMMAPVFWQGLQPNPAKKGLSDTRTAQLHALAEKKRMGNEQVVAKDVTRSAALYVYHCRTMLTDLSNKLAHARTPGERLDLMYQQIKQHPQFVSLNLIDGTHPPLRAGLQPLRPDLQRQAYALHSKDKFFISNLYRTANAKTPVAMTICVPVVNNTQVAGALTADVDMGHLMQVMDIQDRQFGTKSKLLGIDGENQQLTDMLTDNSPKTQGQKQAYLLDQNTYLAKVQGTSWRVHVTSMANKQPIELTPAHDEILVRFAQDLTPAELKKMCQAIQGKLVRSNSRHTYIFQSGNLPVSIVVNYFKSRGALIVEPHVRYRTNEADDFNDNGSMVEPNDTFYNTNQWNLVQIFADRAWSQTTGNPKITIAVVDTGVDLKHPDMRGRLTQGVNILDTSKPPQDDNGHGTHVAGIIGARTNNNEGVAGINWNSKIMPVKVMDAHGTGTAMDIADGIVWATDHGADVINLSLGEYQDSSYLHDAIKYAHDHGVVVVSAMGNDGTNKLCYPAAYPEVISVAANDETGQSANFSNYGSYTSVSAPGVAIPSTYPNHRYATMSGTSMASPHVAGVAALIKSVNPKLSTDDVRNILQQTADDLGPPGRDDYYGYGQVNVYHAVQAAAATLTTK